jgi:hypothetical protein
VCIVLGKWVCQTFIYGYILTKYGCNSLKYIISQGGLYYFTFNIRLLEIYFHWYKILGLLYERALFDLQFVHNLFWLKLKWNARSKLFYCIIYHSSMLWWSSRTLTKSRRTTVIQDLLVWRLFSLVPDNRTNVNVEDCCVTGNCTSVY